MRIVHEADLNFKSRKDQGRGGGGHQGAVIFDATSLGRDPERADNFYFGLSIAGEGEFSTPRHRHIFDQYRYMVEGFGDYPEGDMVAGVLGYFPQGAYYGPQDTLHGTVFVLQFGGPSGQGYIDRTLMEKASRELRARNVGAFDGTGSYERNPGIAGEMVQDAHEAISEYVRGEKLQYPEPQYKSPLLIDSNAYPWLAVEGASGVSEKALGTFTSCQFKTARYRLEPGAHFLATGRGVYVVLAGTGTLDGEKYAKFTSLYLEEGEQANFSAGQTSDILLLGLPRMALMQQPVVQETAAAA